MKPHTRYDLLDMGAWVVAVSAVLFGGYVVADDPLMAAIYFAAALIWGFGISTLAHHQSRKLREAGL